ncbi:MAG: protein phosphatase CheZ [Deltaproteobacteria bacterium]|nr:protein phosphatase CheZ [Deltaproteobacteria bacterium]
MTASEVDEKIASLVEITDAILRGEFDKEAAEVLDAQGVLASLAQKINKMVVNMRTVEAPLSSAGEHAPSVVSSAHNVIELMSQSTGEVLNKADRLTELADQLEHVLTDAEGGNTALARGMVLTMKASIFDIIASQSYQDVARQKMEALIGELNQMRDWLVEALVVLNIGKSSTSENLQKKKELLKEAKKTIPDGPLSQDLVDDLLAEFGF